PPPLPPEEHHRMPELHGCRAGRPAQAPSHWPEGPGKALEGLWDLIIKEPEGSAPSQRDRIAERPRAATRSALCWRFRTGAHWAAAWTSTSPPPRRRARASIRR